MNTHDHDNDALPGEDELKALYRSLPRKEPSPELDRAVKRAASDAVRSARSHAVSRWPVAVASVAMVVVAAGLGWRMMQQPSSVPQIPTARSVPADTVPTPAASTPSPMPQPASAPVINAAAEPTTPPQPMPRRATATSPLLPEHENIRSAMKPKVVARTVAPALPAAVMEAPAMAPAMPVSQESANAAYSPLPAPAPPPAPPAPPAPPVQMQAAPAEASAPPLASPAASAPMGGQSLHMRAMAAPAPILPAQDATAANPADTPAQELVKIRRLFAQQRREEALQRLAAFQQAHPDIPLPDDLRAQLPDHE
jgi:Meckel syndrome type 1 protein